MGPMGVYVAFYPLYPYVRGTPNSSDQCPFSLCQFSVANNMRHTSAIAESRRTELGRWKSNAGSDPVKSEVPFLALQDFLCVPARLTATVRVFLKTKQPQYMLSILRRAQAATEGASA